MAAYAWRRPAELEWRCKRHERRDHQAASYLPLRPPRAMRICIPVSPALSEKYGELRRERWGFRPRCRSAGWRGWSILWQAQSLWCGALLLHSATQIGRSQVVGYGKSVTGRKNSILEAAMYTLVMTFFLLQTFFPNSPHTPRAIANAS